MYEATKIKTVDNWSMAILVSSSSLGLYQYGRENSRTKYSTFESTSLTWFKGQIFLQGKRQKIYFSMDITNQYLGTPELLE